MRNQREENKKDEFYDFIHKWATPFFFSNLAFTITAFNLFGLEKYRGWVISES